MTRPALAALFLALAAAWFGTLGVRPLYKADESRYAEIPREMVASGDWITPRLNGFKYFEKPPLQYWGTAVFFELLGERDWVSRLWTALAGFAGILLACFAGNRLFRPPAGLLAATVLAGCPLYVLLAQVNTLDMGLTFFLSAAIFALALGRPLLFWAACAAAVLSKGLIGIVLPLVTVGLYVLLRRDWALLAKMRIGSGGALFLALAAPWFIAVSLANAEFAHFFFVQEHFQRFTTTLHGRDQPAWYFVPVLAVGAAPWLLAVFPALKTALQGKTAAGFDARLLFALWALVVFLFFSASGSKLPSYILPLFPPLAVLIGSWLASAGAPRLVAVQAALAVVAGLAAAGFAPDLLGSYPDYLPWVIGAAAAVVVLGAAAFAFASRGAPFPAVAALALCGFVATQLALIGHRSLAPLFSAAGLIARAAPEPPAGARVFALDAYDHSLPWYLRRTVTLVGYKDELAQAVQWEAHKFIPDAAGFARAWNAERTAYAVVPVRDYERLRSELPMTLVSRDPRYVFVRKP